MRHHYRLHSIGMICVIYLFLTNALFAQGNPAEVRVWSERDVEEICNRASINPDALLELKSAPLDLTFEKLMAMWYAFVANPSYPDGHDISYSQKMQLIVSEVLLKNPKLEEYMTKELRSYTELLLKFDTDREFVATYNGPELYGIFLSVINLAAQLPGDVAFRLVGPCLFGSYYPVRDLGDATMISPAERTRQTLAWLAQTRLNEKLPEDIEGAREWWKKAEPRFAVKGAGLKTTDIVSTRPSTSDVPIEGALLSASQQTSVTEHQVASIEDKQPLLANRFWIVSLVALGLVAVYFAAWRRAIITK